MESNEKKKVLVVVGLIIVVIALLAYLLSILDNEENTASNNSPSTAEPSETNEPNEINEEIVKLEDADVFFSLQLIINNYFEYITANNADKLLELIDSEYIEDNHINASNIFSIIRSDYEKPSYVAKNIYYNPDSAVTYYFIEGYLLDIPFIGNDYNFYDAVMFLVIVDESTNYYVLRPVSATDIQSYANNYELVARDITSQNKFNINSLDLEARLTTYLSEFMNLLIYFPAEAYELLSDDKKDTYASSDDFETQVDLIYDELSTRIFSYSTQVEDDFTMYKIVDDNQNKIVIYEYGINDFKISY